jgi:hypothetical protein
MRVVCAWCEKEISPGLSQEKGISHGICEECTKKVNQKAKALEIQLAERLSRE